MQAVSYTHLDVYKRQGQAFVRLKPFDERAHDKELSVESITKKLFGVASKYPDAKIVFFSPPSVPGFGSSDGFSAVLLDKSGGNLRELDNVCLLYTSRCV